ncbi:unnamed protein product [Diatraea saccharalis]|uniref:Kynurenine formamidase n=1 Tax=Diatraea saccharalis TaxID=40085 RepID=A0A9P0G246_9NEOP|nr:unnamed protein product [Diatraea saccharalis]
MSVKAVVLLLLACFIVSIYTRGNELNNLLFNGDYEFIDLTHPFDNNTVYWPNSQQFIFIKKTEDLGNDDSWYAANDFAAGEHGGTHIDAPYHFYKDGLHVEELPLDKLIVPLIVADVSSKVNGDPNFVLHKGDLDFMINDNMGKPCVIIFKFGWSKYFNDRKKYLGHVDNSDKLNFPGLSGEVAEWITSAYKNIVGIGVDVASIDPGSSKDFPVHKTTSRNGLYVIENVNFSRDIPDNGCTALVLPMKIKSGTGAPLRLVAICPKQRK